MFVTDVDYPNQTLTVTRGWNGTARVALEDNDILIAGIAHLPELGDANLGTGRVPTVEKYNFTSMFSESFRISHIQDVAAMGQTGQGRVATVEWEVANKMFEIKRKVNKALLFQHKGTETTGDGTIYVSQGFIHYIEDNVLDVGSNNENLSWPILSDWLDTMFEPTASSSEKLCNAGNRLFGAVNRFQRDMSAPSTSYYDENLKTDALRVQTEEGNVCTFIRDNKGFPIDEGLGGWGVVVDMQHAFLRELVDTPMTWRREIQAGTAHFRQDEYWGSFSLELRHPSVHGYIRGAGRAIIE
jgi:hypothetical protein